MKQFLLRALVSLEIISIAAVFFMILTWSGTSGDTKMLKSEVEVTRIQVK